ncbi:Agamous-like mads-box protein agl80 [Thalictrum thalictroides]|uniref:Agamous-like mads-box protein agl80 n=1 Tax=Thalictrum thalictroides TaxID=46969 RepID=A0A7J6V644_THATH|nr:Agamous-like mads-box protein agl80 [Thalictrum thalictroides]
MSSLSHSSSPTRKPTRKKIKLAWMPDHVARKISYRKRKNNLVKKIGELRTLCDVKACAIIYSPTDPKPYVWPSNDEARSLLIKFLSLPNFRQTKKLFNLENFLKQQIVKLEGKLERAAKSTRDEEMISLIIRSANGEILHGLKHEDVVDMEWYIEQRMMEIYERGLGYEQPILGYYGRMMIDPMEVNQVQPVMDMEIDHHCCVQETCFFYGAYQTETGLIVSLDPQRFAYNGGDLGMPDASNSVWPNNFHP